MTTEEVRVQVPRERLGEFYRFFGEWLDERPTEDLERPLATDLIAEEEPTNDSLVEAATKWWRSLAYKESAVWSLWIDVAPKRLTGQQIVDRLGFKHTRDIAGALGWSGRKGEKVGFPVGWYFAYDAEGNPLYGLSSVGDITVEEYATILRTARDRVVSERI